MQTEILIASIAALATFALAYIATRRNPSKAFAQRKAQRAHRDYMESSARALMSHRPDGLARESTKSESVAHASMVDALIAGELQALKARRPTHATHGHALYKSTARALVAASRNDATIH